MASTTTMILYILTDPEERGTNFFLYAMDEEGTIIEIHLVSIGKHMATGLAKKLRKEKFCIVTQFSLNKREECTYLRLSADKSKVRYLTLQHNSAIHSGAQSTWGRWAVCPTKIQNRPLKQFQRAKKSYFYLWKGLKTNGHGHFVLKRALVIAKLFWALIHSFLHIMSDPGFKL